MNLVMMLTVPYNLHEKIAKFNTETKELLYWTEENCLPSEPVFVPRPNGESEDDGKNTLHQHDAPFTVFIDRNEKCFFFFFKQVWSCHQLSTPTRASHVTC